MDHYALIRKIMALLLWLVAIIVLTWYWIQSTLLWWQAILRQETLAQDQRLSVKSGIRVTVGVILLHFGVALWFPELLPTLRIGLVVAIFLGLSTWRGIKIRQNHGRILAKTKKSNESTN